MGISLITAAELLELTEESGAVTVIDTRTDEEYREGHIPNALPLAWEDWCAKAPPTLCDEAQQPGYWGLLSEQDDREIARRLSALGLDQEQTIVVYASGKKSKGREGRVAWMLLYLGAKDVRLLDGGLDAWRNSRGGIQIGAFSSSNRQFKFNVVRDERRRILIDELKRVMQKKPAPLLIDTRTKKEFVGDSYPYMPRPGSLPAAHLLPYASIFNDDGSFVGKEKFASLMPGGEDAERKITFCEVGVRACTVALLHEIYTGEIVAVYDGSMMEWGANPELPVVKSGD